MSDVLYTGSDDTLLAWSLWKEWKFRCHWEGEPLAFPEVEIDHIVPKSLSSRDRGKLRRLNIPEDLNLNDPSNLAPICHRHNSEKSALTWFESPTIHVRSARAQALKAKVVAEVERSKKQPEIVRALIRAAGLDLTDRSSLSTLKKFGPGLMQSLAQAGLDYRTVKFGLLGLANGLGEWSIETSLAEEGRVTRGVAEKVCKLDWDFLVQDVALAAFRCLDDYIEGEVRYWVINNHDRHLEPQSSSIEDLSILINSASFEYEVGGEFTYVFEGVLAGESESYGAQQDGTGDELEYLPAWVTFEQKFVVFVAVLIDDPSSLSVLDARLAGGSEAGVSMG